MHWNKLLTLLAIGLIPITAKSQVVQSSTEGKTEFVPHWFMQVQAGAFLRQLLSTAAISLHRSGDCVPE